MATPLTEAERARLPALLRRRLWAATINELCDGIATAPLPSVADVQAECRAWIAMIDGLSPGDVVRLHAPGHVLDGMAVTVSAVDPVCNLAPPDTPPRPAHIVFVQHPSLADPVGVGADKVFPCTAVPRGTRATDQPDLFGNGVAR